MLTPNLTDQLVGILAPHAEWCDGQWCGRCSAEYATVAAVQDAARDGAWEAVRLLVDDGGRYEAVLGLYAAGGRGQVAA